MPRDQLEIVQTLAERHEKEAGGRLSSAQADVASAQSQLNQVLDYRVDYYALATGSGKAAIDTNQLKTARHFLSQLDSIIGRQQVTLQQNERQLEQFRTAWIEAKRRLTAIQKLRQSRATERSKAEEKVMQRLLDDLFVSQSVISDREHRSSQRTLS
jgi:flagellar export protein FliJ